MNIKVEDMIVDDFIISYREDLTNIGIRSQRIRL